MRMRCVLLMVVLLAGDLVAAGAPQVPGSLTIISAQRAKSYATPASEYKPRDEVADVVIVVRVAGLSRDDFRKIRQDTISLAVGEEKLPPSLVLTGVVDERAELKAVFIGPKAPLAMALAMGDYAPVTFTAEEAIAEQLR